MNPDAAGCGCLPYRAWHTLAVWTIPFNCNKEPPGCLIWWTSFLGRPGIATLFALHQSSISLSTKASVVKLRVGGFSSTHLESQPVKFLDDLHLLLHAHGQPVGLHHKPEGLQENHRQAHSQRGGCTVSPRPCSFIRRLQRFWPGGVKVGPARRPSKQVDQPTTVCFPFQFCPDQ